MYGMKRTKCGNFLSAMVVGDLHLHNVVSMVGLAAMVMLPLEADNFGCVLLLLRMGG